MKTKVRYLAIFLACLGTVFIAYSAFSAATKGTKDRPTISAGDRALAVIEVQNTMSKHAYYHAAGKHLQELADLWVKEDGPYAATATWTNDSGIMEGMVVLKKVYGQGLVDNQKKLLEQISKIVPEIKNVPENLGVGYEYSMHFQTTPVIEIAGDGKTAKGIWYSPGVHIGGSVLEGGATTMRGGWWMEKYGVDFVKEDGKWKIWHIGMYYDNTPPDWTYENGQAVSNVAGAAGAGAKPLLTTTTDTQHEANAAAVAAKTPAGGGAGGAPGGGAGGAPGGGAVGAPGGGAGAGPGSTAGVSLKTNPDPYKAWSPLRASKIAPKFPEPYYTFSETFTY